jgi:hypothetical protein
MKAITILQPHASLIAVGAKRYETRSWKTNYRGPIAIHAGKNRDSWYGDCDKAYLRAVYDALKPVFYPDMMCNQQDLWDAAPYGAIIAIAELVECWKIEGLWERDSIEHKPYANISLNNGAPFRTLREPEILFGDYKPGRYAWELSNVCALPEPLPCRGRQRLWTVPPEIEAEMQKGGD